MNKITKAKEAKEAAGVKKIKDYHLCLNKKGYLIKKDQVDGKILAEIKKNLTVSPIVLKAYLDLVKPVEFTIFQESPNYLYVPRFYGIEKFGTPRKNYLLDSQPINLKFIYDLLPHQINGYSKTLQTLREIGGGILQVGCGWGKCMGKGTPILMYDGSIKMVEDVVVGDQLMGDDSTPRNVLSLARGQEEMYEICPIKGDHWVCNKSHILSLKCSTNHSYWFYKGSIHDIELSDFLNYPKKFHKSTAPLRLYKVPIIFPPKEVDLDPYVLGYWLGEGRSNKLCIPHDYKCNSRKIQLRVLAGLIDSNGHLRDNMYKFTLTNEQLLDDIIFICRSLGFAAYKSTVRKTCTNSFSPRALQTNPDDKYERVTGIYYSCCIYGEGLEKIPVLLAYKKATPRKQMKDPLVNGFSVKPLGIGDYYGFAIDGNHRFLLGDFTVTHNTAVSIKLATDLGQKTLVVVNKEFLMDQWIDSITKFTGGKARIGIVQQNKADVKDKDFVVAMLHSLCLKEYPEDLFSDVGYTVCDEVHHISSEMFSKALPKITSKYMLGLSATPNRKDGLSHVFYKYLGNICHSERRKGNNQVVVKRLKLQSDSPMYETLYMSNGITNTVSMVSNLTKFEARTEIILESIRLLMKQDRKILLLSGRREHLENLHKLLETSNIRNSQGKPITYGYYWGNQGSNKKKHRQLLNESAKCDVVLGTVSVASEGLDIPDLNTEIIATPATEVEQAVGRILRKYHATLNPLVIDLVDHCGNFPQQATKRSKFYKTEDYEIQDFKMSLDHTPIVTKEFEEFLLNTKFKHKRYVAKDDESHDENETKIGRCLLDDEDEPTTQAPKPVELKHEPKLELKLITPTLKPTSTVKKTPKCLL